jgi:hypothetical protein
MGKGAEEIAKGLDKGIWTSPWNEATGAFVVKNSRGGINWYRY